MYTHPDAIDNGPQYIITHADRVVFCSQEPTTYAQATATYLLAQHTLTTELTLANGSSGSRVLTLAGLVDVSPEAGVLASCTHLALVDDAGSGKLLQVSPTETYAMETGVPFTTGPRTVTYPQLELVA